MGGGGGQPRTTRMEAFGGGAGLNGRDRGGSGGGGLRREVRGSIRDVFAARVRWLVQVEQGVKDALAALGFGVFGDGGEGAEFGVEFDVLDGFLLFFAVVFARGLLAREVDGGDLKAVEEETGASRVDGVGGDAAEDLGDGDLDAGAVFGVGDFEGGFGGVLLGRPRRGLAGGVVVVAECLVAERFGAAAVPSGEDVAALVGFRCGVRHMCIPPWVEV